MRLAAISAAVAAVLSFGAAWKIQAWRWSAADAERLRAEQLAAEQRARQADAASAGHEKDRTQARVQFQTIYRDVDRVVEKPIYRNVCIDADGMRQLARAVGVAEPAASEPSRALPGPVDAQ